MWDKGSRCAAPITRCFQTNWHFPTAWSGLCTIAAKQKQTKDAARSYLNLGKSTVVVLFLFFAPERLQDCAYPNICYIKVVMQIKCSNNANRELSDPVWIKEFGSPYLKFSWKCCVTYLFDSCSKTRIYEANQTLPALQNGKRTQIITSLSRLCFSCQLIPMNFWPPKSEKITYQVSTN